MKLKGIFSASVVKIATSVADYDLLAGDRLMPTVPCKVLIDLQLT